MFKTLRNRLIFSHILPSVIIIPLLGVIMLYMLENQVLLPLVYKNLAADAHLIADISGSRLELWVDRAYAQAFLQGANEFLSGEVDLVFIDGSVWASSEAGNAALPNRKVDLPNLDGLGRDDVLELQHGPSAEVYTLVVSEEGQIIGVVRVTSRVVTVSEELYQLRFLIGGMLVAAVAAGVVLGSYLAISISRPIQQVTNSIATLASGNWDHHLEVTGTMETRALANTVNVLIDRLHSLEQARRQLLANLVHELGRPLGAFRSAIQALLKGADQDQPLSRELLSGMDGETERMQRLLDELAQLHDQVLGSLELHRVGLDVAAWLPGVLAPWKAAAIQKELAWDVSIQPGQPNLSADPDRLAQAIGNIIENAIKFTPKYGRVSIESYTVDGSLWFQVQDSGPGIPIDEQETVFEPFYRGDQGKRIVQGMGLGLSITRDIIQAHGGEILVESKPGEGSLFSFWLPQNPS